jgi:hypothetical protein
LRLFYLLGNYFHFPETYTFPESWIEYGKKSQAALRNVLNCERGDAHGSCGTVRWGQALSAAETTVELTGMV